ncbi:Nuclear factor interleukin-3-regulated protein [Trichinella britovi]|uniref:Nuclear factor interleukin-3-regulated protein n=1 Tax=Trichinella britovi TaxID=45882 RepID=A0A0V1CFU2_TRIBR|nr:Nuclear factor interleukin-3-regulated protein [Trichinella britovi]
MHALAGSQFSCSKNEKPAKPVSHKMTDFSDNKERSKTCMINSDDQTQEEKLYDDRYWEKRRRNNEAARRSRERRRLNDLATESRLTALSKENEMLKSELEAIRKLIPNSALNCAISPPVHPPLARVGPFTLDAGALTQTPSLTPYGWNWLPGTPATAPFNLSNPATTAAAALVMGASFLDGKQCLRYKLLEKQQKQQQQQQQQQETVKKSTCSVDVGHVSKNSPAPPKPTETADSTTEDPGPKPSVERQRRSTEVSTGCSSSVDSLSPTSLDPVTGASPFSQSSTDDGTERYLERRRRNNEAAKRCRANRRALFEARYRRVKELERENGRIREEARQLGRELAELRERLGQRQRLESGKKPDESNSDEHDEGVSVGKSSSDTDSLLDQYLINNKPLDYSTCKTPTQKRLLKSTVAR